MDLPGCRDIQVIWMCHVKPVRRQEEEEAGGRGEGHLDHLLCFLYWWFA
jgi:hypothetical protein